MKVAAEHVFTGATQAIESYDSTKTLLGSLLNQYTGATPVDKYISTKLSAQVNNLEIAGGQSLFCPCVFQRSANIFWVFAGSNATAAATRNIGLYEFDSNIGSIAWKGFITLSGTTIAGSKTIRGLRVMVTEHIDGTVSTNGVSATITGVGTKFTDDRIAVGARIGFGTTNPTLVSAWYDITAITDNLTLVINAPVDVQAGTAYVIEEIRVLVAITNTTLQNSGLFLIKGLHENVFTFAGTTISEATTVDNIRASYLLKDILPGTVTISIASPTVITQNGHGRIPNDIVTFTTTDALPTGISANTSYYVSSTDLTENTFKISTSQGGALVNATNTQSGVHTLHSGNGCANTGVASDDAVSRTTHDVYLINLDTSATIRFSKFNIRADLTVVGGISKSAFIDKTGISTITGTASQINNGRMFTVSHGVATGQKSIWFTTSTRIYRTSLDRVVANATNIFSDFMLEIPPGTATTHALTNSLNQIDVSSTIDRLIIPFNSLRFGAYLAQYNPSSSTPADKIFGANLNKLKLTTSSPDAPIILSQSAVMTIWTEGGYLFSMPSVVTTGLNTLTIIPVGADGAYGATTNQRIITPKLATPNATKFYRAYVDNARYIGTYALGYPPESFKLYYRTAGIDDNSGTWIEILSGDLSGSTPGTHIQFMFELDVLGETCLPSRIYAVSCTYEDSSQDSHYQPSLTKSSAISGTIAWKQVLAWNSVIPTLQIRIYNADTGFLVLDDNTAIQSSGVFQYSADGTNWLDWDNTADSINYYIRYTATTLPNNITIRALLTQS